MNADDIAALNDQIVAMAKSGLPLDRGLESLSKELSRGRLRAMTEALVTDLRSGLPLPEALKRRKDEIPPYYAAIVQAGIRSGRLADSLTVLANYARMASHLRRTLIDALIYPAIVLAASAALLFGLGTYLLPRFREMYTAFGIPLPWLTEQVLWMVDHYVLEILGGVFLLFALLFTVLVYSARSPGGYSRTAAAILYKIPLLGEIYRAARLALFTDLLAMLIEYGTPLDETFRIAAGASLDPYVADEAKRTADRLAQGMPLAEAIEGRGMIPVWIAWMMGEGEKLGTLAESLRHIADFHRRRAELRTMLFRQIFPPLIVLLVAGLATGGFISVMMMPNLKLLEALTK